MCVCLQLSEYTGYKTKNMLSFENINSSPIKPHVVQLLFTNTSPFSVLCLRNFSHPRLSGFWQGRAGSKLRKEHSPPASRTPRQELYDVMFPKQSMKDTRGREKMQPPAGTRMSFILSSMWKSDRTMESPVKLLAFFQSWKKRCYTETLCFLQITVSECFGELEREVPIALCVRNGNLPGLSNNSQCSDLGDAKESKDCEKTAPGKVSAFWLQSRAKAKSCPKATLRNITVS